MALELRNFPNHSLLMAFSIPTPLDLLEAYGFCGRLEMWTWNIFALLIHVPVKVKGSISNWLLSAIYASPCRSERRVLWINLSFVSLNVESYGLIFLLLMIFMTFPRLWWGTLMILFLVRTNGIIDLLLVILPSFMHV